MEKTIRTKYYVIQYRENGKWNWNNIDDTEYTSEQADANVRALNDSNASVAFRKRYLRTATEQVLSVRNHKQECGTKKKSVKKIELMNFNVPERRMVRITLTDSTVITAVADGYDGYRQTGGTDEDRTITEPFAREYSPWLHGMER